VLLLPPPWPFYDDPISHARLFEISWQIPWLESIGAAFFLGRTVACPMTDRCDLHFVLVDPACRLNPKWGSSDSPTHITLAAALRDSDLTIFGKVIGSICPPFS